MKYRHKASSGFSMIEVLVTTVILALGILGTSALQVVGLKGTDAAHYRTVATFIANEMAQRIRMNPLGVESGSYVTDTDNPIVCSPIATETLDCSTGVCTPSELAIFDQTQLICGHVAKTTTTNNWKKAGKTGIVNTLPNGSLTINCGGSTCGAGVNHVIKIAWTERTSSIEQGIADTNVVISILP